MVEVPGRRPIRVDMLVPNGLDGPGGIARVSAVLAEEFAKGDEVHLRTIRTRLHPDKSWAEALLPFYLLRFLVTVLLRRPDVVHVNLSVGGSTLRKSLFALIARTLRIPYVIHLHGSTYDAFFQRLSPRLKDLVRGMFRYASAVIVLGSYWRRHVVEDIGVAAERVVVVDNAAPAPDDVPQTDSDSDPVVLFLGEIGTRKGVPELLQALADERVRALPWRAVFAGEGAIEPYRDMAERLELSDRVNFIGWVGPQDVARRLREASLFALPSRAENQPMSIIEAMGAELAVVATTVGAVPEMIEDGRTGLLVPPGDAPALARALQQLLESPDRRRALARAARATYEQRFTPAVQARRVVDVYRAVLSRSSIPS
jgi:glycosyltransferase involved in cell wall biosynthesis